MSKDLCHHGNPKGSLAPCIECANPPDICPFCFALVASGMLREHGVNGHRAIIAPPKDARGTSGVG